QAGLTDLNILQENASVQGYGSIVNGRYQDATNTHSFEDLNVARLSGVSFNTLDLKALISLPIYFGEPLTAGAAIPLGQQKAISAPGVLLTTSTSPSAPP